MDFGHILLFFLWILATVGFSVYRFWSFVDLNGIWPVKFVCFCVGLPVSVSVSVCKLALTVDEEEMKERHSTSLPLINF